MGDSAAPAASSESLVRRVVRLLAWLATAGIGTVAASQAFGGTWLAPLFVLQALTPYLVVLGVPLLVVAVWLRARLMALLALAGVLGLGSLLIPMFDRPELPVVEPTAPRLVVAHANAYFENERHDLAAVDIMSIEADVLAVTEYSYEVAEQLTRQGVAERYPYRAVRDAPYRNGIALFSKFPLVDALVAPIGTQMGIVATVEVGGRPVRVIVAHPLPGVRQQDIGQWADDLRSLGRLVGSSDVPTLVVGDLNSSRWHPPYRHLLAWGLTDAHEALGRPWSMSWPMDKPGPPFVRIDHALFTDGIVPVEIRDVEVTGSDHLAFVLTAAVAAPATP
jgi:endonuclease/exonuclease/phosphatase (EEP) superfamily protein YafD